MRVFVQRSLSFGLICCAAMLSGLVLAQADAAPSTDAATPLEAPEEVTVRGRRSAGEYRLELERARNDIFRIFNAANAGTRTDVQCKNEQPTGSRMRQTVCRTKAENDADDAAAQAFLNGLFRSAGNYVQDGAPGTQVVANIATGQAQAAGASGELTALQQWEIEWKRLLSENRDLYNAVVKYAELEDEYAQARGDTTAPLPDLLRGAPPEQSPQQVCEASTLTEYEQRNNAALVSGIVSISSCTAGTTGSFTVVARVRNDAGETNSLEFNETWQRADAEDHRFESQYPIGENVFLSSVRVRDLQCTCVAPVQ